MGSSQQHLDVESTLLIFIGIFDQEFLEPKNIQKPYKTPNGSFSQERRFLQATTKILGVLNND